MDSCDTLNSCANNSFDKSSNVSLSAKMRRLKIQEDLLVQNIKKHMPICCGDGENNFIKSQLEFTKFLSALKNSYADIKHLFEDVKYTTNSKDVLKTLDIDDIKKDVLELDNKIKGFKTYIQRELTELKKTEKDLLKKLNEDATLNIKIKKNTKLTKKTYSDIIPSPVKIIMNSPLKCPEVQQFQDFINSSSNKYGGWNEYNHNIFVRVWQKHFQSEDENFDTEQIDYIEKDSFIDEVLEKVSDLRRKDIIYHMKWYNKFLYLKKCQKNALDEWRAKTRPIRENVVIQRSKHNKDAKSINPNTNQNARKKALRKASKRGRRILKQEVFSDESIDMYSPSLEENMFLNSVDANEFFKEMVNFRDCHTGFDSNNISTEFQFARPTKQWENRCNSTTDSRGFNSNLDDISKLGVPSWRHGLMKNNFKLC